MTFCKTSGEPGIEIPPSNTCDILEPPLERSRNFTQTFYLALRLPETQKQ